MVCLNVAKLVMVDRLVRKPCCSLIIMFFNIGNSLSFINFVKILGMIDIIEIGR